MQLFSKFDPQSQGMIQNVYSFYIDHYILFSIFLFSLLI